MKPGTDPLETLIQSAKIWAVGKSRNRSVGATGVRHNHDSYQGVVYLPEEDENTS